MLESFFHHRMREHGCGCRAVTGGIVGFRCRFLHQLRAHVLEWIFQFDFFGDRDTVFGNSRSAVFFIDHDVASLGTHRRGDGACEVCDTFKDFLTGVISEN